MTKAELKRNAWQVLGMAVAAFVIWLIIGAMVDWEPDHMAMDLLRNLMLFYAGGSVCLFTVAGKTED